MLCPCCQSPGTVAVYAIVMGFVLFLALIHWIERN